ncbi:MAG: HEPN domain-containing protein [FCB group bacterium]|nr:HEPN domain-containing protein [FCB group bacterium]
MNRDKFQNIALVRLEEAEKLLEHKLYSGAYYLAGYCVECALKACICKRTEQYDFPPQNIKSIYTHDLSVLLRTSELDSLFSQDRHRNNELDSNWAIVNEWKEKSRYDYIDAIKAISLIEAISDEENGVLQWIKQHW